MTTDHSFKSVWIIPFLFLSLVLSCSDDNSNSKNNRKTFEGKVNFDGYYLASIVEPTTDRNVEISWYFQSKNSIHQIKKIHETSNPTSKVVRTEDGIWTLSEMTPTGNHNEYKVTFTNSSIQITLHTLEVVSEWNNSNEGSIAEIDVPVYTSETTTHELTLTFSEDKNTILETEIINDNPLTVTYSYKLTDYNYNTNIVVPQTSNITNDYYDTNTATEYDYNDTDTTTSQLSSLEGKVNFNGYYYASYVDDTIQPSQLDKVFLYFKSDNTLHQITARYNQNEYYLPTLEQEDDLTFDISKITPIKNTDKYKIQFNRTKAFTTLYTDDSIISWNIRHLSLTQPKFKNTPFDVNDIVGGKISYATFTFSEDKNTIKQENPNGNDIIFNYVEK